MTLCQWRQKRAVSHAIQKQRIASGISLSTAWPTAIQNFSSPVESRTSNHASVRRSVPAAEAAP